MDGLKPSAEAFVPGEANIPKGMAGAASFVPAAQKQQQQMQHQNAAAQHHENLFERLTCRACEPLPQRKSYSSIQLPPELRARFAHNFKLTMQHLALDDPRCKEVPKQYFLVSPLENSKGGAAGSTGYPSSVFKVCSRKDGLVYCLRRIDNIRGAQNLQQQCDAVAHLWSRVRHANVIPLRQLFVHQRALFLLHDYYPGAITLGELVVQQPALLPEKVLWSVATQLLQAIRAVHDKGLSFRGGLGLERVLLTGQHRLRVAGAGLMHMLEDSSRTGEEEMQREDVMAFARVMLTLACMSTNASLDFVGSRYSKDLTVLIAAGFQQPSSPSTRPPGVYDLLALCSRGLLAEIDELYSQTDAFEEHLARQLETGRLNRLLIKLNLVNERPEYGKSESASWAETGDRYILKLFRNYIFHQTDEAGKPWLGIGHIITSLNKLDIGSSDKILLTSRDGKSILIVTFADMRRCLEDAFQELSAGHRSTQYYQLKRANPARVAASARPIHAAAMHHPMQQMGTGGYMGAPGAPGMPGDWQGGYPGGPGGGGIGGGGIGGGGIGGGGIGGGGLHLYTAAQHHQYPL